MPGLIPLCFRSDCPGALRALSRQGNREPLIRAIERAQRWTSLVDWSTMDATLAQLRETNALIPPDEAEESGLILRDPPTMKQ